MEAEPNLTQVKLYLTPDAHEKLRRASDASGRSMSVLVGAMVEWFLDDTSAILSPPDPEDPRIKEARKRLTDRRSKPDRAFVENYMRDKFHA